MAAGTDRHAHGPAPGADMRWLAGALALILAFMAGEVIAGLAAHSLALISDAAHMLTDAAAIALVLVTTRLAARPPAGGYTYGLKRAEILSAQANGITLVLLAAWLGYTAIRRLVTPPAVAGGVVLVVALVGMAVNVVATLLIAQAGSGGKTPARRGGVWRGRPPGQQSLNVAGAFKHIVTDLYAFTATAVAGLIILLTGFSRADAIATLVVVVLMLYAGAGLIRDSGRIFLEAAPAGLSPAAVGTALAARPHVAEIHDLHIWEITSGLPAASAHVLVMPDADCHAVRADLEAFLSGEYGITHATLQVDHTPVQAGQANGSTRGVSGAAAPDLHCDDAHGPAYRPGDDGLVGLEARVDKASHVALIFSVAATPVGHRRGWTVYAGGPSAWLDRLRRWAIGVAGPFTFVLGAGRGASRAPGAGPRECRSPARAVARPAPAPPRPGREQAGRTGRPATYRRRRPPRAGALRSASSRPATAAAGPHRPGPRRCAPPPPPTACRDEPPAGTAGLRRAPPPRARRPRRARAATRARARLPAAPR